MLFVIEYEVEWDHLETTIAKRLELQEAPLEGFEFIGEYFWHNGEPPFRGVVICEAESVEAVHGFVLHYGPSLKVSVHPATDVMTGIGLLDREG